MVVANATSFGIGGGRLDVRGCRWTNDAHDCGRARGVNRVGVHAKLRLQALPHPQKSDGEVGGLTVPAG